MNLESAKEFIDTLFVNIWSNGKEDLLEKYYTKDVVGYTKNQSFGLEAIKSRMKFVKDNFTQYQNHVDQVFLIDDETIVFQARQTGIDVNTNKRISLPLTGIYKVKNNKVYKLWILSDFDFDYFAEQDDLSFEKVSRERFYKLLEEHRWLEKQPSVELTEREKECLFYFLNGYTSKESARILGLSYRTIETYIAAIKDKYLCASKSELRDKILLS